MARIVALGKKTEAFLASAKRAKEKFIVEIVLSYLASLHQDFAGSARWRQQAIAICAAALREPEIPQENELMRFQLMNELGRLGTSARAAKKKIRSAKSWRRRMPLCPNRKTPPVATASRHGRT